MILSDSDIREAIKNGRIQLEPGLAENQLRPVGIRVHLGNDLLIPRAGQMVDFDAPKELQYDKVDVSKQSFMLKPGAFVLGCTREQVKNAGDLLCVLDGRSTIARLGMAIHNASVVLDSAQTQWTSPVLEISNHGNFDIVLRAGIPVGMFIFQELKSASDGQANSHYQHQRTTTAPDIRGGAQPLN